MKILSGPKIKEADAFTILHEPISSIDLMERASSAFFSKFSELYFAPCKVSVFCGPGNNGGDGLAIARMLHLAKYDVSVYFLDIGGNFSDDFLINQQRMKELAPDRILYLNDITQFPIVAKGEIIIDSLFGTGFSRTIDGLVAQVINGINDSENFIVSVDIPSGLFTDVQNENESRIIKATHTITFQLPKLSFFFCSNSSYTGEWHVLDIGLNKEYIDKAETRNFYIDQKLAQSILKPRQRCDHKGTYGHALTWAGSYGKIGAAQLCARACLNAGAGLTTAYIPSIGYSIFQTALPEIMVLTDANKDVLTQVPDVSKYNAIGIGPGIDKDVKTAQALSELLARAKDIPVVIDADALNIISENKNLLKSLPKHSILTPHPKEFERLTGPAKTDWERQEMASKFAQECNCVLVLKGAYTTVNLPNGKTYFNATGNPGMAKGGSGDALTGIITGLLAQKYSTEEAAILGVYIHGLAGDFAAKKKSSWSMTASDLIENLGEAFQTIDQ